MLHRFILRMGYHVTMFAIPDSAASRGYRPATVFVPTTVAGHLIGHSLAVS